MNQQTCNRAWLDAFLKNDLNQCEEQMLTSHLDECSDCREELESRAAEESVWREASNLLGGSILLSTAAIGDSRSSTVHSPQIALVLQQLAPTDDPESLGRIGGYEVTGVVGAGGMGVVLKAHDRSLDRIVAIKVMSPHLASSGSARKRFAREAKAAAAVLHPNVIAIHSVASEDANPYLVMPFVRGASLQKRIDSQGPLPLKDTLRIGAQIAAGLAAAHEQGLVHRDIKPANILLEEGVERVTITDFGLARAVDDASMTCSGVIAGTPQYMSPEQARGEPIDARSDLFSLGGVLYAMCTGRSPFRAETTYGVLHRIANDNPTPVCEVNTDVPVWLGHVIERLMAKRPEDRFESAAQVAELLEGCLAHVQQPAAMPLPEAVAALAPKKTRRPPIGKFIAAAAVGACALLFAGVLIVLELGKGTLTIESELDDVPIRIMQGDKVVEKMTVSKSGNSVRVAAGMYVVELDAKLDGMVVENDQVSLKRGTTEHIVIRLSTREEHAGDNHHQSASESNGSKTPFSAPDGQAKIIVDIYGGNRVLGQDNVRYAKMVQALDAIDDVQVNFREAGPGSEVALVIVRDPAGLMKQEALGAGELSDYEAARRLLEQAKNDATSLQAELANERDQVRIAEELAAKGLISEEELYLKKKAVKTHSEKLLKAEGFVEEAYANLASKENRIQAKRNAISKALEHVPNVRWEEGPTIAAEEAVNAIPERTSSTPKTNEPNTSSKSSPEYPPVKIVVHDEEGKPLEGVKVSLYQLAKDQGGQVLEINETSNTTGLAVNRNLPYGHYELSATTADGWFLSGHGSKLNVEFEKGLLLKLVVPTPAPFGKLTIRDDANLRLAGSAGLRFGTLEELVNNGPAFSISPVPEPDGDLGEYSNFPTVTNGIEQVGIEIRFEMMAKNISQPSPSGTHLNSKWKWTPVDKAKSSCRYLIVDGQARAFVNQSVYHDIPFHGLPMEECEMFKLPSAKHRVGGSLFALHEPTAMPLEVEIPAGEMSIYVERIIGKPSLTTMKALNWVPHKDQPELWLEADVQRDSAWFERLIDTSAWIRTTLKPGYNEIAGHLQMHRLIRAGETLEVSLAPKQMNPKTLLASEARTLDDITSIYNEQTRLLRTELFTPSIPDLTTAQMRDAMLDAAEQYRKQGRVEVSSSLKTSAETNRLADALTFMGMCGTMSDGFRQITPQFNFEATSNSALMVVLGKAELRYSRNGWSSRTWGDIDPPITGKWELVSVEQRGETLTQAAYAEWRKSQENWTGLTIDQTSLTMAGNNAAKFDFSIDYVAGPLPQYTISQNGNTKYSGVLMSNGFIDDNELVVAVDLEGTSTPQTFHTTDGKSTKLTYRRMPAKPQTEQVIDALVTFEFNGVVGNATLNTSGIGWIIDQRGHILVPDEMAPRSEDYSIEVRYADGSRTAAKRVFNFGHLALLKPEKAPAIVPIRLNSPRSVKDGDQVLAILNGTDVQKGTVTSAKKTIVSLDSWPILYSPRLRFPNAIETDFKSDAATLFGAPLLAPSGEVVGMLLNYKPPMFAIPLSEIQIACREFESSQKQTPETAVKAAQGAPTPGLNDESKAPAIDHRNARSVVEAYVASAFAGDVAMAASLAKNSPADPKRIRELPEFLNVQRLKIETVYVNDPAKPTRALATSVAVKLDEEHKNPDGRRDGFMVFTLELTDDKWLVTDIDFESESGAEKELNEFLKANPKSIGIPPHS